MIVTSREGRVSRNQLPLLEVQQVLVTSREGRVSRNMAYVMNQFGQMGHVPRGACE